MDINFELYKVFYYVAKDLSFSAASEHLFISQSAVSQGIKTLEKKMQCQLFTRNTKQVSLTQEGQVLFRHIEQAFNFIKTGERSIQELHSLQQGEVRIGASDTICKYYLLPYFKKFNQLYPHIKIHVTNRTSPKCIQLLEKGKVDLAVVNLPKEQKNKDLEIQMLKQIQDVFIANQAFDHLQGKVITLEELAEYPLLMLEKNTTTRIFVDEYTQKQGIQLNPEFELGSIDLLVELAKIGLGISLVVKDYIAAELTNQEVFTLTLQESLPPRSLGVITNKKLSLPIAAQKFISLLSP